MAMKTQIEPSATLTFAGGGGDAGTGTSDPPSYGPGGKVGALVRVRRRVKRAFAAKLRVSRMGGAVSSKGETVVDLQMESVAVPNDQVHKLADQLIDTRKQTSELVRYV